MTCAQCNADRSNGRPSLVLGADGSKLLGFWEKAKKAVDQGTDIAVMVNDTINPQQAEEREIKREQQATTPWIVAAAAVLVIGLVAVWAINRNN